MRTLLLGLAGCRGGNGSGDPPAAASASVAAVAPTCVSATLRPATAAPAEGLWIYEDSAMGQRVAAMVGPAHPADGSARILRRVEALEVKDGDRPLRYETDTASVRLEILPPFRDARLTSLDRASGDSDRPAATYAVDARTLVAAYEPCAASGELPRIRYIRRDARGGVVTDVMLRRESAESERFPR